MMLNPFKLLGRRAGRQQNAAVAQGSLRDPDYGFTDTTNASVTTGSARTIEIVYSAINLLGGTLATLPMSLMDLRDGQSVPAQSRLQHYAVHHEPQVGWTPARFFDAFYLNALLFGNAAAWVKPGKGFKLLPWHRISYECLSDAEWYTLPGGVRVPSDEVVHLRAPSACGNAGDSPIAMCAKALGVSLSAEAFAESFYRRAVGMSGHVETDKEIEWEAEDRKKFIKSFRGQFSGPQNAGKTGILPPGSKYIQPTAVMRDAQHVEQQLHQTRVVARIFNLPPHLLGDNAKTSYSSIEQEQIRFVVGSLRPWIVRAEQEFGMKTLSRPDRRRGMRYMVNVDALLRGDATTRVDVLTKEIAGGLRTINEGRAKIDLPPVEGGDRILVPANNLAPLESVAAAEPEVVEPPRSADNYAPLFVDACERMLKIETREIDRRGDSISVEWAEVFYDRHVDRVRDAHRYICGWIAKQLNLSVDDVLDAASSVTSRGATLAAIRENEVPGLLNSWTNRAEGDADRIVQAINRLIGASNDE
ncbi:MAG: phage portal protein [Planctomycetota bacterium]